MTECPHGLGVGQEDRLRKGDPQAGGLGRRQGVLAEVDTGGGARRDEELALGGWSLRWLHDTENVVGSSEERSEAETQL